MPEFLRATTLTTFNTVLKTYLYLRIHGARRRIDGDMNLYIILKQISQLICENVEKGEKILMAETIHLVEFSGKTIETTVTNKAFVARHWLQNIIKQRENTSNTNRIVGMGCKCIRHPISSTNNKIAVLQLCVDTKCLMLQLLHMDSIPHDSIVDFLSDPHTTFVGVEIQDNSRRLLEEYALKVNHKVDLHFLAKHWFPVSYKGRPSLKALAHGVLGLSPRRKCTSDYKGDWESIVLDQELIDQACAEAYTYYSIALKLLQDR